MCVKLVDVVCALSSVGAGEEEINSSKWKPTAFS